MFKFAKKRQVLWPVTIQVPRDDGSGEADDIDIKVRFELLSKSVLDKLTLEDMTAVNSDDMNALLAAVTDDKIAERRALVEEHVKDWEGIVDADSGAPVPYSADNLAALLEVPTVYAAFHRGLRDASMGAFVKNSKAGLDG